MRSLSLLILAAGLIACPLGLRTNPPPPSPPVPPSPPPLQVSNVSPRVADPGEALTIDGQGFDVSAVIVTVGGQIAPLVSKTPSQLKVITPDLTLGDYLVKVKNGPNGNPVVRRGPAVLAGRDGGQNPAVIPSQIYLAVPAPVTQQQIQAGLTASNGFITPTIKRFVPPPAGSSGVCAKTLVLIEDKSLSVKGLATAFRKAFPESSYPDWRGDPVHFGGGDGDPGPTDPTNGLPWQAVNAPSSATLGGLVGKLASVRVAVLDTGVSDHPEFNLGTSNVVLRADGASFTDAAATGEAAGFNDQFASDGNQIPEGHGTGVAAIIAAPDGNYDSKLYGLMVGIAPGASILPVRVCSRRNGALGADSLLSSPPSCHGFEVAVGVCYAVAKGAKVLNLSLGGEYPSPILYDILHESAVDKKISVVASAGNDGVSSPRHFPASHSIAWPGEFEAGIPGLIAVGSVDLEGSSPVRRSVFSSVGPWVNLVAPGRAILTAAAFRNGNPASYRALTGTSFAAPFVTGAVVLLYAQDPDRTPEAVKSLVLRGDLVVPLDCDARDSSRCGRGLLNVSRSLGLP